MKLKHLDEEND